MSVVTMRQLLEAGCHYGHQTRKWNPSMKNYIYTAKNGVHIIDLAKTMECLDAAYAKMKEITEAGGKVLFVGTKKQAQQAITDEALRSGSFYVNQRWLGGTLTNFRTIQKSVKRLLEIEAMQTSGQINLYTKKEIAGYLKEQQRLENFLGGIKEMKRLPDALFIVDPTEEHNAVAEARKLHIPVFALIDTNANPDWVDYPIPCNDDAVRSIKLMAAVMADAVVEGKGGLPLTANQPSEQEDITMADVLVSVDQVAKEMERRRREKIEERRNRENRRNFNGERRVIKKDDGTETKVDGEGRVRVRKQVNTEAAAAAPAKEGE